LEVNRVTIADAKTGQVEQSTLIPGTLHGQVVGMDKVYKEIENKNGEKVAGSDFMGRSAARRPAFFFMRTILATEWPPNSCSYLRFRIALEIVMNCLLHLLFRPKAKPMSDFPPKQDADNRSRPIPLFAKALRTRTRLGKRTRFNRLCRKILNVKRNSPRFRAIRSGGSTLRPISRDGIQILISGQPGEPPYTRGIHATMHRGRLWTMRQFAGFGTAEDTNQRFRYLLAQGQSGLSTAFDLPT